MFLPSNQRRCVIFDMRVALLVTVVSAGWANLLWLVGCISKFSADKKRIVTRIQGEGFLAVSKCRVEGGRGVSYHIVAHVALLPPMQWFMVGKFPSLKP